jgi:rhomboid protease GluP
LSEPTQNNTGERPTICSNCGSIVGGGESQCAVCGATTTRDISSRKSRSMPDRETLRFARAVLDRPYKFTIALIVANLFVFLLMWQSSGLTSHALLEFPDQVLLAYGAKLNILIRENHEWWRFITPMFVHVNLPHLLVNMYSLWMVGPYVEKLYGSAKFVVFWVVTGIAGVIASYLTVRPDAAIGPVGRFLFKSADVPSAGASGALFGLVGVLFVFGIKFRHELPEGFKRAFGTGMLPIIMINLFIGYLGRGFIDNAAHMGGLLSGSLLALAVNYRRPGERSGVAVVWQTLKGLCLVLVAISFLMAYRHAPVLRASPVLVQGDENQAAKFLSYAKVMNEAQEAFYYALQDHDTSRLDKTLKEIDGAPQLDAKSDELRQSLKTLLTEAKSISGNNETKLSAKAIQEKQHALTRQFLAWSQDYGTWLKTTGRNYGGMIEIKEEERPTK